MDFGLTDLTESIESAHIAQWLVEDGEYVQKGEDILELVTDKALFTVAAPDSGVLVRVRAEGDEINRPDIIGTITQRGRDGRSE